MPKPKGRPVAPRWRTRADEHRSMREIIAIAFLIGHGYAVQEGDQVPTSRHHTFTASAWTIESARKLLRAIEADPDP